MSDIQAYIRSLRGPILVTGASGFVGANLFRMILAARPDVYACVRQEKGWRLTDISDEKIAAVDLNDPAATKNLVDSINPQTVFDCIAYGGYSFENDAVPHLPDQFPVHRPADRLSGAEAARCFHPCGQLLGIRHQ